MARFVSAPEQIAEIFQVAPHTVALSDGKTELTYSQLNQKANQFAAYLADVGVVPGNTVAICMERSFDWIVAALGIMRAGAAYVPLDSAWPDARLAFALNDSQAVALVAREALLNRLLVEQTNPLHNSIRGIDPLRDADSIALCDSQQSRDIMAGDLAYMIYTSGSTGTPKAVEITHSNLAHLLRWYHEAFRVTQRDRASHLLGLAFDAAVMEIWAHLTAGATLCLAEESVRSSPQSLQQWLLQQQISVSLLPTVLGRQLMEMDWPEKTTLRLLIVGGDTLHSSPARQLPFSVVNNYGPTECTVAATWSVLETGAEGAPPIGIPITGANVYLLDEQGQQVANGETGEICIGGDGVGRGYRNLPELTLARFVPDPFAPTQHPPARMYRTGDRGCRRPDGQIEFRGRLDRQTKIRGFRIELDEISSHLSRHESIQSSTVVAIPAPSGENQLVAYLVPKDKLSDPSASALQQHLRASLPDYMVPAMFYALDELPLSPNGKIDMARLATGTEGRRLEGVPTREPATTVEAKVLAIVRNLLKNDSITTGDNFFLAGGHSLLGTQLLVRLREQFGVTLALRQLFDSPTVEGISRLVEQSQEEVWLTRVWGELLRRDGVQVEDDFFSIGGEAEMLATLQGRIAVEYGRTIPLPELVAARTVRQQAELLSSKPVTRRVLPLGVIEIQPKGSGNSIYWMHYLNFNVASHVGEGQPFYVVRMMAEDFPHLGDAPDLATIAACHLEKVLAAKPHGPYIIGGLCLGAIVAFEVARQLRARGEEVLLLLADPPNPAQLEGGMHPRLTQALYLAKRVKSLGLKTSVARLRQRFVPKPALAAPSEQARTESKIVQAMVENAAFAYQLRPYDGETLVILASERPPHLDALPVWQKALGQMQLEMFPGHHEDMIDEKKSGPIGDMIQDYLSAVTVESLVAVCE